MNKKNLLTLIPCLFLSGCGVTESVTNFVKGDDDDEVVKEVLVEIQPTINIENIWTTDVGGGADGLYLKLTPVANNGVIYSAETEGDVVALEMETGKKIWKKDTDKRLSGGPGFGEGMILLGTRDGEVLALSENDGKLLWTSQVSSEILSAPKADSNVIVARTVDGKVFGLNAATGQRLWVYDRAVPVLTLRGTSSPQIAEGLVITGFDNGVLVALDLQTGQQIWERRIALPSGRSTLERIVDIDAELVIYDGVIFAATYQGRVAAVRLDSGQILWARELSSYAGVSVDVDHVYVTDDNSEIWALDRYSGNSVWKQDLLKTRVLTAPTIAGDYLVAGDSEGYLHWLNRLDGELSSRARPDKSEIITPPFSVGNTVYSYSTEGTLSAYRSVLAQ